MKKYTRGFTLIELLVVIAIIGILASVVLVSLNSARNKGKDARVISSVQQMRIQAESRFNGTDYSGTFAAAGNSATTHKAGITDAGEAATLMTDVGNQGSTIYAITDAGPKVFAIYGQLVSDNTKYFCIDSTGKTNQNQTISNATSCI